MNKKIILVVVMSVFLSGFGFADFAQAAAQPISGIDISAKKKPGGIAVQGDPIPGIPVGLEGEDEFITSSDLGVDNVGTLPTSNFYFLKEWGRGIDRLFTWKAVSRVKLELKITNEKAAELQAVAKNSTAVNYTGLERALKNYTNAQERLNSRITTINGTSNVSEQLNDLLTEVDEKTAKHAVVLEQIALRWNSDPYAEDSARKDSIGDPDFDLLTKGLKDAENNTLKTFTVTVTPINDAPSLKQKAEDEIKSAGVVIEEAGDALAQVSTTRGIRWDPVSGVASYIKVMVPKQTQGATFGEKIKAPGSISGKEMMDAITVTGVNDFLADGNQVWDDTDILHIFDRWGNMIAKAKGNLESAKKAFAEGKYGEAYGQARSAGAMVSTNTFISGGATQLEKSKEQKIDEPKERNSPVETKIKIDTNTSAEASKILENESPRPIDRKTTEPASTSSLQDIINTEEDNEVVKEFSMKSFVEMVDGKPKPQYSLKEIVVNKGDRVRIKITVTSGMHDFKIDEYGIYADTQLNKESVIEFVADKAGEFVYYCTKPGHRQNGQWGTLKVIGVARE